MRGQSNPLSQTAHKLGLWPYWWTTTLEVQESANYTAKPGDMVICPNALIHTGWGVGDGLVETMFLKHRKKLNKFGVFSTWRTGRGSI